MRIVLGSDHAGVDLKQVLGDRLKVLGHSCEATDPVDYPDIAESVAAAVLAGTAERGILICGSGVGASIAANKLPGIRAGLCHDTYSARQGVEHDNVNILILGARVVGEALAVELATTFLNAHFTEEARHQRRLAKISELERRATGSGT